MKKNKFIIIKVLLLLLAKKIVYGDNLESMNEVEENMIKEVTTHFSHEKIQDDDNTKSKLKAHVSSDQFVAIMEEISILRLENNMYKSGLEETSKKLKQQIHEMEEMRLAYETKLQTALTGIGERASKTLLEDIRTKGVLQDKLNFKVQVGIFNNYEDANDLKNKLRSLGQKTWIVCMYKGFVVPLEMILESIKTHKEYGGTEES